MVRHYALMYSFHTLLNLLNLTENHERSREWAFVCIQRPCGSLRELCNRFGSIHQDTVSEHWSTVFIGFGIKIFYPANFLARLCKLHGGLICITFCLSQSGLDQQREKLIHIYQSIGDRNLKLYRNIPRLQDNL